MRPLPILSLLALAGCGQACAIGKGLYQALVHRSGAPSREERAAIHQRSAQFLRDAHDQRILVLPIAVMGRVVTYDTSSAFALAERLRTGGLRATNATTTSVPVSFQPQANEAAIFWARFHALADTVRAHPPIDADYVLMVDVFGTKQPASVDAVHVMVVTTKGEMAYSGGWNSAQPLYKEMRPRSLDDAARMVATDIQRRRADLISRS